MFQIHRHNKQTFFQFNPEKATKKPQELSGPKNTCMPQLYSVLFVRLSSFEPCSAQFIRIETSRAYPFVFTFSMAILIRVKSKPFSKLLCTSIGRAPFFEFLQRGRDIAITWPRSKYKHSTSLTPPLLLTYQSIH